MLKEDALNVGLDLAGLIPGIGEFADAANALLYASRGEYLLAGLSLISTIPALGDAVGKGGKVALWLQKTAPKLSGKIAKYGPDVANGIRTIKTLIIQNKPLIQKIFAALKQESTKNPIANKLSAHTPKIWEALDVFTRSQEMTDMQQESIFLPSLMETLFSEDYDLEEMLHDADSAASDKDAETANALLTRYSTLRNDGSPEPLRGGDAKAAKIKGKLCKK